MLENETIEAIAEWWSSYWYEKGTPLRKLMKKIYFSVNGIEYDTIYHEYEDKMKNE